MSGHRAAVPPIAHVLQLFDTSESRASALAEFLREGWEAGDRLLVLATSRHWNDANQLLRDGGCPIEDAVIEDRLIVLDARTLLSSVMNRGEPDAALFENAVGAVVARLAAGDHGRLRVYGELIDLLAEEGHLDGACRLEDFWNSLRERYPFMLLCGYSAAHFAAPAGATALHEMCNRHTEVRCDSSDTLGTWLLLHEHTERTRRGSRETV